MSRKIFKNILFVAFAALLLCCTLMTAAVYNVAGNNVKQNLKQSANMISVALQNTGDETQLLYSLANNGVRITLLASDGSVLYDSETPAADMPNHLGRTEVADALVAGAGESYRWSDTLLAKTHYYALLLPDGRVVRTAADQQSVTSTVASLLWVFIAIAIVTLFISLFIARRASKKIVKPINQIDLDDPLGNEVYEELSPLLVKISRQNEEIQLKLAELRRSRNEFSAVANNLNEGLVLLNKKGVILTANASACALFQSPGDMAGHDLLSLSRSLELKSAADLALRGKSSEQTAQFFGRTYTIMANPVRAGETITGCVIIILDITEKHHAEQLRKEFSANVSHELKTPLQSISGYAEIIKDGVAKQHDIPRFIEKIHAESLRLIALVDDIMKLSRLDEGALTLEKQPVELLQLCAQTADGLEDKALAANVRVEVSGESAVVFGVQPVLQEIAHNLVENAIKYNRPGGNVLVEVKKLDAAAMLRVSDTGIGIDEQHRSRIFERFYRIDSARSREAGGTGLGLSIVKHGAAYHNAAVELQSEPGHGTIITVTFPTE